MNYESIIQKLLGKLTQEIYANAQLSALLDKCELKIQELEEEIKKNKETSESEDLEWKNEKN